jgi:hypothetical protein
MLRCERNENFQKLLYAVVLQGMFKEAVADLMGEPAPNRAMPPEPIEFKQEPTDFEERMDKYFAHSAETFHRDAWGMEI